MVKVKYNDTVNQIIIRKFNLRWNRGDVKDVDELTAKELVKVKGFSYTDDVVIKEVKKETNDDINFDLNNDGVVDEKDMSIAGKVLSHGRKTKKSKKQ